MALAHHLSQPLYHREQTVAPTRRTPAALSMNLNRLLSAAVVSPSFRHLLLSDPVAALAAGYNGEDFSLTPVEYMAVTSLQVTTIREFAAQLLHRFAQDANDTPGHLVEEKREYYRATVTAPQPALARQ